MPDASFIQCPDCGASLAHDDRDCWLCRLRFKQSPAVAVPAEAAPAVAVRTPGEVAPATSTQSTPATPPQSPPATRVQTAAATPIQTAPAAPADRIHLQFSVTSILLVTTLVAVCLGVFRLSLVAGVFVVVLATPALIRAIVVSAAEKRYGHRLSIADKINTFVASIGVIILGVSAGLAACVGACFSAAPLVVIPFVGEVVFPVALLVSAVVGVWVAVLVIRSFAPRRQ